MSCSSLGRGRGCLASCDPYPRIRKNLQTSRDDLDTAITIHPRAGNDEGYGDGGGRRGRGGGRGRGGMDSAAFGREDFADTAQGGGDGGGGADWQQFLNNYFDDKE